jgi:hypothetical protein
MKQVQAQERVQQRQRIHEPGTGLGAPGKGTGQRGGMRSGGNGGGGRGPR